MSERSLHTATVRAANSEPQKAILFLHGILGSGGNLRGLAQSFVQASPEHAGLLVDLRLHGRSRSAEPPHDVFACADDLRRLAHTLPLPVSAIVGHSFGGKVALAFHALRPELERLVLLDSDPGANPERVGSEQTMEVLELLAGLPTHYGRREEFIERVQVAGQPRAVAEWLAMNLERSGGGFELRLDLAGIGALLDSYFSFDAWSVLEQSNARIDVVIGGRSGVWDEADRQRVLALAREKAGRLRVTILPEAGHWVHVDAAPALREVLLSAQNETP
jgi:pimeloyl-ACP methyl ester carboxylesterase